MADSGSATQTSQLSRFDSEPSSVAPLEVTLLATGSEVPMAFSARDELEAAGIRTAIISIPCWEMFEAEVGSDRDAVRRPGAITMAVEAALRFGCERWIGRDSGFISMTGFGASGSAGELFEHFGITVKAVGRTVRWRWPAEA